MRSQRFSSIYHDYRTPNAYVHLNILTPCILYYAMIIGVRAFFRQLVHYAGTGYQDSASSAGARYRAVSSSLKNNVIFQIVVSRSHLTALEAQKGSLTTLLSRERCPEHPKGQEHRVILQDSDTPYISFSPKIPTIECRPAPIKVLLSLLCSLFHHVRSHGKNQYLIRHRS